MLNGGLHRSLSPTVATEPRLSRIVKAAAIGAAELGLVRAVMPIELMSRVDRRGLPRL